MKDREREVNPGETSLSKCPAKSIIPFYLVYHGEILNQRRLDIENLIVFWIGAEYTENLMEFVPLKMDLSGIVSGLLC